jgi:sugar lactone lactonase YvrE
VAGAYELVREWGGQGSADGQFDQPGGLAFGLDGSLFVCDQVNHRVQRFTREGTFLSKWGEYGDAPGQFGAPEKPANRVGGPCLLAIDRQGNLYTTEPTAGRIQKFSPEGKYLASWGSNDVRTGAFGGGKNLQGPIAILFDRHNRAWVSATNNRVQLFTAEGRYLTGLGTTATPGSEPGQFRIPHGMALDNQGVLYIADTQNHRVQKFAFDRRP